MVLELGALELGGASEGVIDSGMSSAAETPKSDAESRPGSHPTAWTPILALPIGFFALILVRHAWVTEDAYITFRTVENFIDGYGLVWNVGERVQAYTHPLWMALHVVAFYVTREFFYTTTALCLGVSLLTVFLYARRAAETTATAVVGILALVGSKAFMDYSACGLENPLTHLTLVLFAIEFLRRDERPNRLLRLSLLASVGMLTRLDALCFFLPALVWEAWRQRSKKTVGALLLGVTPVMLWELFSLFYYGFLFPNTAYAKLATGIPQGALAQQGLLYLLSAVAYDPITPLLLGLGVALPFLTRRWRLMPLVVGVILNLVYVVSVGGDFMAGRFLSGSLLMAVILASNCGIDLEMRRVTSLCLAVVLAGLIAPYPTVLSGEDYGHNREFHIDYKGVADERAVYYKAAGLMRARRNTIMPDHKLVGEGLKMRMSGTAIELRQAVGYLGYFAGPKVQIVDQCALTDPLLARLPLAPGSKWRIGHYWRDIPDGYIETLHTGENQIVDPDLAAYYDKIRIVTRGPLFSKERLTEIVKFNLGYYDDLLPG